MKLVLTPHCCFASDTASPKAFALTLEDEPGTCSLAVFKKKFEKYRTSMLCVEGRVQRESNICISS